ncbi:MAG: dipeptidyl peptidase 3 [Tannerellaceae bacterium]|jgi:dipeptidyl-peptidase-3|nr:dipeptidyl peptidase 3 [Tannerellaceae bacterium]
MSLTFFNACNSKQAYSNTATAENNSLDYVVDKFADTQVLRYKVPGFEDLSLQQKQLLFHLSEAALIGRDILYDQNCRYNLAIRRMLEQIFLDSKCDRNDRQFKELEIYLKRVWFANGIHHHYAEDKFTPGFSQDFLADRLQEIAGNTSGEASLTFLRKGQSLQQFIDEIFPVIFSPDVLAKRTVQSGDGDIILASANNYYAGGITQKEVEDFYEKQRQPDDLTPPSYGLNSRLVKEPDGRITEKTWKIGGLYSDAIEKIVEQLEKALPFAENQAQKAVIVKLIAFYRTGDLRTFDAYAILWLKDTASEIDFVNGFTETYGDPLGIKASWESTVNFINKEATKRTKIISDNAQWFEDHSPVDPRFKKTTVKGISAKVITVVMLGGDCYPSTPIGINLPNAEWIRRDHGSKSVTIENITEAYDQAALGNGFNDEFVRSDVEKELIEKYGFLADNLHTDLHECLGHGSGQILPGISPDTLKSYGATLEEARADLFGLYYIADPKLVELGVMPDSEAFKAEYYRFMMNGLITQLVRIEPGKDIEEAHMRNRQLIAKWVYEKGKTSNIPVVELIKSNQKTYVRINDYNALRNLFGKLLAEVQRIKSEGDYQAGKALVETYGVKVDQDIHAETLERYRKLNLSPYKGFVNPTMKLIRNDKGEAVDVTLDYSENYTQQMLRYSRDYSFLPTYNE